MDQVSGDGRVTKATDFILVNVTRREQVHFVHLLKASKRGIPGVPAAAAVASWYQIHHRGDQIQFVDPSGTEWPFTEGSRKDLETYTDKTETTIEALIDAGILADGGRVRTKSDKPAKPSPTPSEQKPTSDSNTVHSIVPAGLNHVHTGRPSEADSWRQRYGLLLAANIWLAFVLSTAMLQLRHHWASVEPAPALPSFAALIFSYGWWAIALYLGVSLIGFIAAHREKGLWRLLPSSFYGIVLSELIVIGFLVLGLILPTLQMEYSQP